jgi:hypothetical protein
MWSKRAVLLISTVIVAFGICIAEAKTVKGGGSGDIPTPLLNSANRAVELADGEHYVLIGQVLYWNDMPWFEVDLNEQPWLASANRVKSPFYPLEGSHDYWLKYQNRRVKIVVGATGAVQTTASGGLVYSIHLFPLAGPIILN